MAESLRDLVVSLSLNTENFTRNIKSVNKQIQEAESYFKLAAAGIEGFENTTEGLTAKLSTLERRLQLQKDVVTQYERALAQATSKLTECYDRQTDYAQRLEQARQRQSALNAEVQNATGAYTRYRDSLGESDSATIAAKANMEAAQKEYEAATAEVNQLAGQQDALRKATQNAADAVSTQQTQLNKAQAAVRETETAVRGCNDALRLSQTNWQAAGDRMRNADTAVSSLGKQMQLAQSRFRLAAAGIKEVDTNAGALSAKLVMLNEKLSLQQQTVSRYEEKLQAAREQLIAAQQAHDPDKIREASDAVTDAETALTNAQAAVREIEAAIRETNQQLNTAKSLWTAAGNSLTEFSKGCEAVSKTTGAIGRTLSTYVTAPVLALGATAMKSSIEFESAFTGVRKTVDATETEFAQLEATVKRMSTEIAADTTEISNVMANAGQLGIRTDALEDFTRVMIDLGNTTDIVAEEAGSTLAKFANIMDMDQGLFENLGSTLVDLGNNFATTESAIMEMALRLAGAGKQIGLSEAQILGFATALSSVGIEAQMGGSALSKAMIKMEVAAATGGEALTDFSTICGMTEQQFVQMWEADPAAVFQSFIEGLAKMDDEGMSAIAVLNEIGISEVRLRDTLLRSVNATELFASAQSTANRAWEENTALAEEAGKRYATTESKLINLKNKSVLFAQQLGDDLNPTIHSLIDGVDDLMDRFMEMDEVERKQIIQTAAFAASIGPAFLALSKLTKGLSTVTGGIGKFATSVGKAGGGFKGFMSVLGKSPSVWLAVAAAVVVGTVALADYVSGAKQAREALEGMTETAEKWKDTAAETFYGSSEGLSFFGMTESDFTNEQQTAQEWLSGLIAVWTDGQKETDEIVSHWTESFKTLTASTREALTELKETADANGYTSVSAQLQSDIEQLDALDQEIERLLKKRQNGYFSENDQIRLQELIDTREAIVVKYHLTPAETDGFETIAQKVEAEVARAHARGKIDADVSVYENAMVAAAEGMAAINAQIDAQYDKEYGLIMLIEDAAERQAALDELNLKYNENRRAAALEYAQTMASIVMPVWQQDDIQQAAADIDTLNQKLREYSMASETDKPGLLADLNEITANMDEGALIEYIGLLTQIQSLLDSGLTEAEIEAMFPEIDVSGAMEQLASVQDYLDTHKLELPGLASMFSEAIPEEALKIATDLDMTGAQARWDEFAANPGAITTDAIIASYQENEETQKIQPTVDAFVSGYTEIPEGADTAQLTPQGVIAYVEKYAEVTTGADVSGLTPEIATCFVAGYQELASGTDVSLLKPSDIVAYVTNYAEQQGVDISGLAPEGVTAFVMAYQEIDGGALTTALTPADVAAIVTEYLLSENVDLSKVSDAQVDAMVTAYAEAANCDKTALKAEVVAQITEYVQAEGLNPPILTTKVQITGYEFLTYQDFQENSGLSVEVPVRLGEVSEDDLATLNANGKIKYWQDGIEIPVTAVPEGAITADTIATMDEDGTMHILISPQVTGTQEAIDAISPLVDEVDKLGVTAAGMWAGIMPATTMDLIGSAVNRINSYTKTLDYNGWQKFWAALRGESTNHGVLDQSMRYDFNSQTVAELSAYVGEMVAAIMQGKQVSEEDIANLQAIVTFLNGLDTTETGAHILEGVAQGMTEAGWDSDAETVATNLETALNKALQINSPSKRVKPVGDYVAAGVGTGMGEHDFSTDAATAATSIEAAIAAAFPATLLTAYGTAGMQGIADAMSSYSMGTTGSAVATNVKSAVNANLTSTTLRSAGVNAMAGLKAGINAGRSGVISAMRSAARAAVNAAKSELKIHSPSEVFEDEVGVMTMRGFGQGVLKESKEQARVIRNAARYLTDEAREGAIINNATTNHKTYNQSSNITLSGNTFTIRDEQDIYALATEIATLTRRQQRGKGLRMA
ncbi:MAG: phage tail tape measure protein [Clostridia bacterium]|nr:phage tail tape measure protein [Clostridia bacterium]